ncbi:hypothetical protein BDV96DRAFT_590086 [Lophiotrema nucula]|uniref:AAA+ ATPase domain-containing protein n=1 Tax=Lophiotrema nucula TaxID=690887 RepID=A0A6A5YJD5_9PLEO|nr:hypothetical protein BDV96DRAFT_590086 [Lophiotrema nucula]
MVALLQHVRKNTQHQKKELEIQFITAQGVSDTRYVERKLMKHFDMEVGPKQELVTELQDFFDPRTEEYYHQNGTPYRKGLLLYGPPGTGKTSLSKAIAGEYGLELIIFNLADMTDAVLMRRFDELPKQCVVLFEDIDSMGIVRETTLPVQQQHQPKLPEDEGEYEDEEEDEGSSSDENTCTTGPVQRNLIQQHIKQVKRPRLRTKVTLSGLLNTIDGPGTKEGRLVIFTTNAPNGLDEALIRPGRVDKIIYLGFSSHQTSAITFKRVYITDHQNQLTEARIERLAVEFGRRVPNNEFTTCKLNRYCMQLHRNQPQKAIDDLDDWVDRERKKKNRPFEYDINETAGSVDATDDKGVEAMDNDFKFEQLLTDKTDDASNADPEVVSSSMRTIPEKFHSLDTNTLELKTISFRRAGAAALVGAAVTGFGKAFVRFFQSSETRKVVPTFYSPGIGRLNRYSPTHQLSNVSQPPQPEEMKKSHSENCDANEKHSRTSCSGNIESGVLPVDDNETDEEVGINTPSTGNSSSDIAADNISSKFARYRQPDHEDLLGRHNQHPYHGPVTDTANSSASAIGVKKGSEGTVLLRARSPKPVDDFDVLTLKHGGSNEDQ